MNAERLVYETAYDIALDLQSALWHTCESIQIAGSLRRGQEFVKDIEIVAIPKMTAQQRDLFGGVEEISLLSQKLDAMRDAGEIEPRRDAPAWGSKHRRFSFEGMPVDLFTATETNRGLILMLRTGPSSWNKRLVMTRIRGGMLPGGWKIAEGQLWNSAGALVPTPDERSVFEALGIDSVPPSRRG